MESANKKRQFKVKVLLPMLAIVILSILVISLFSSLVVIRHLCKTDPKLAEETVVEFSDYLRGNLDSLALSDPILFERELCHVEAYLKIEKKRFGDKLNVIYDIKAKDFLIPALTLQPIVENSVRNGITKKEQGGTLEVRTEETENSIVITVIDDGIGFEAGFKATNEGLKNERSHVGIDNVRERLKTMCCGSLEIQSKPGAGTTVVLTIPK